MYVRTHLRAKFPHLLSYTRFVVKFLPHMFVPLAIYLHTQMGVCTLVNPMCEYFLGDETGEMQRRTLHRHVGKQGDGVHERFAQQSAGQMPHIMGPNTLDRSALHELTEDSIDAVAPAGKLVAQAWPGVALALAKGRQQLHTALRQALDGRLQPHHRVLLVALLGHIDYLEQTIAQLQDAIAERLAAVEEAVALLQTVPAVGPTAAATIVSEIGADMSRFPSAKHLASWAGLCPGNHESAGKRLSGKTTKGDKYLRTVLCEVAWGVARSPGTYLHAQYHRLARRRGKAHAVVAVAHSLLVAIYHVLATHQPYADLGPDYFDQLDAGRLERHYVRRQEQLGYAVTLAPQVA